MQMDRQGARNRQKITRTDLKIGRVEISRIGVKNWHWSDVYHWVLTLSWPRFFALAICLYLLVNLVFAAAFFALPGSVTNARPGSFADVFFFSIETLATVGYGFMNPATTYGHVVASIEIMVGMLGIAIVTGLMFARFSRPTARIMFSDVAVVTPFDGVPTLMLRAANERNNLILEAAVHASVIRREQTREGTTFFRIHELKLERERNGAFALTWTVMHKIDAASPLYGKTTEDLVACFARIAVAISGLDDTLNDMVHARHEYDAAQVVFGSRFVDILSESAAGVRIVDFTKFHEVEPDGTS
jgi:inward rectifier potassium channel